MVNFSYELKNSITQYMQRAENSNQSTTAPLLPFLINRPNSDRHTVCATKREGAPFLLVKNLPPTEKNNIFLKN